MHQEINRSADHALVMKSAERGGGATRCSASHYIFQHVKHTSRLSTLGTSSKPNTPITLRNSELDAKNFLYNSLECMVIYIFVNIEPPIVVQAA